MMLYVNGQDIARLVLAKLTAVANGWVGEFAVIEGGPESYLKDITTFLASHGLGVEELEGVVVVSGPGSPTALRASHAIVNALAFAKQLKVFSLDKEPQVPDDVALRSLDTVTAKTFAFPHYGKAPTITASPRDALKRKQ